MEISGQIIYYFLEYIKTVLLEMDPQWIDSMNMIFHKALTTYSSCCRAAFPGNRGRFWELSTSDPAWSILVLSGPAAGVICLSSDRATALGFCVLQGSAHSSCSRAGEAEQGQFPSLGKAGGSQQCQGMAPVWFVGEGAPSKASPALIVPG